MAARLARAERNARTRSWRHGWRGHEWRFAQKHSIKQECYRITLRRGTNGVHDCLQRVGLRFRDARLVICGRMGQPPNLSNIRNRDHGPRLKRLKWSHVRVRLHDMRHTRSTHWYAQGVDIRTISDLLGHASPTFTLATYVQATSEAYRRAADLGNDRVTRNRVSRAVKGRSETLKNMARPEGFEPPTYGFVVRRSIR